MLLLAKPICLTSPSVSDCYLMIWEETARLIQDIPIHGLTSSALCRVLLTPMATERLVLRCLTQPILHHWGKMLIFKVVLMVFSFSIGWFDRQIVACAEKDSLVSIVQTEERYGFARSYEAARSSALSGLSVAPIAFPSARGHSSASKSSTSILANLVLAVKWRSYSTYAYNSCLSLYC